MANKDDINEIYSTIASIRAMEDFDVENFLKTSITSSVLSNGTISFILDLFKQAGGMDSITNIISELLTSKLNEIENNLKETLKSQITYNVSCSIDPTIDINQFYIPLKQIDLNNLFKIDPQSKSGKLLYFDVYNNPSKDFNVFLYNNIKGVEKWDVWNSKNNKELFKVKFVEKNLETNENNLLYFDLSVYNQTKKSLLNFVNSYLDSIIIFDKKDILSLVMDSIFGSISSYETSISKDQLLTQEKIDSIITKIINEPENEEELNNEITNDGYGYYSFSNEEYSDLLQKSDDRKAGIYKVYTDKEYKISLNLTQLDYMLSNLDNFDENNIIGQQEEVTTILNNILTTSTNSIPQTDEITVRANIIENIIKKFVSIIVRTILSPKIFLLFSIINKILEKENSNSSESFINDNLNLVKSITKDVASNIINKLTEHLIVIISEMIKTYINAIIKEKTEYYSKQLISLLKI